MLADLPSHLDSSSTLMGSYLGGSNWTGTLGSKRLGSGSCSTILKTVSVRFYDCEERRSFESSLEKLAGLTGGPSSGNGSTSIARGVIRINKQ